MGIKNFLVKSSIKAADKIAKLSTLSPEQLEDLQYRKEVYLSQMPSSDDAAAEEYTRRLLAAESIEIYNEYLRHLKDYYVPLQRRIEYDGEFHTAHNIRYFNITKWVTDKRENNIEKLINVYEVLSNEDCNIALVFHRSMESTSVYLAVTNTQNAGDNVDVDNYKQRLAEAIRGNFPGAEWNDKGCIGSLPCMKKNTAYSVASASNIPAEKSEKFVSQTIEKLLDGIIPDSYTKEYTLILLATPIKDVEDRKLRLAELYSGLAPYASWQTNFTFTESDTMTSNATFGINAGVSAGVQAGNNASVTNSQGITESESDTQTDSSNTTNTDSTGTNTTETSGTTNTNTSGDSYSSGSSYTQSNSDTHTTGTNESNSITGGASAAYQKGGSATVTAGGGVVPGSASVTVNDSVTVTGHVDTTHASGANVSDAHSTGISQGTSNTATHSVSQSIAENVAHAVGNQASHAVANTVGKAVAKTLGKAVTNTVSRTGGIYRGVNMGGNFGANFARSSNVSATVGMNEGIQQSFTNYSIKHTLELLEEQMKRLEQSTALGMWDFAAYVLSEDQNVANNVAHTYLALTQGDSSYMSQTAVNLWRGDMGSHSDDAKEICSYLRELRHPLFGLSPALTTADEDYNAYPAVVTAATSLSGKELAYSLNFPQHSVAGFPVIECAEFGRNVVRYDSVKGQSSIQLGHIFHMNHAESSRVSLSKESLASHTFITGSTGSGKSNTVYQIIDEALDQGVKFLVIEPAKGEYKDIFGMDNNVSVYGTNPYISPMLRLNPFSFPENIHIFEHLDRLVEIFNVCWPMYAAMPAVLKSAIEKSYVDCGWDLMRSANRYGEKVYPNFADVARNIKEIIDTSEYDTENKGAYKGSLLTRLQALTTGINGTIFVADELTLEELFDNNVIVDLSRVGSSETKALIMGMLVLKLQEHRMAETSRMNSRLKHITVLEEAHNLLRRTSTEQSPDSANLMGKSVEMLSNAIAEMRTYGEGFIIVDQAPGLLDMAVIRNTNTKIIMRLPDQGDRELVGRAANLNDDQITELAKLPCGVAAVYQNEWVKPVLCKVEKFGGNLRPYRFALTDDVFAYDKTEAVAESLLDCIMNKELFRKGNRKDIQELRELVIKSKLDTVVKMDFLDYISAEDESVLEPLRKLIYDFTSAENAIEASKGTSEINMWVNSVVNALNPSIKGYSNRQINLALALLLYEQSIRDASYNDLFCRFTEVYRAEGRVY